MLIRASLLLFPAHVALRLLVLNLCLFCSALSPSEMPSPSVSSVQPLSPIQLFTTLWSVAHQASLSITNSQCLPRLISIETVMPSNNLILCHPFLLPPSIFPSIRVLGLNLCEIVSIHSLLVLSSLKLQLSCSLQTSSVILGWEGLGLGEADQKVYSLMAGGGWAG